MTFAVPLFLLAVGAAVIPVILHMINRQKAKDLPFPTLRFLRISAEKTRRRKQIQDVFLMLLRIAAVVLIALGLSKPTLTNLRTLFGSGAYTAVALVVDNSASMGAIDHDKPRIQTALGAANQVMDQLRDGDQVSLLLTSGVPLPEQGKLDRNHDKVRQMLAQVQASNERGDVATKVEEARQLVAKSDLPNKQVFVISDFQENAYESLKKARADQPPPAPSTPRSKAEQDLLDVPIIVVDCHRNPKPNVAVQNIRLEAAVPVAGLPVKAGVELYNASTVPQQRVAELYIDGSKEATSPAINVPAEGRQKYDFLFSFKSGGVHRGEVRLVGEDGSRLDDRRFFSMEIDQGIPVAVVKSARHEIPYLEDTFYLEKALGPGKAGNWAIRLTSLSGDQLPTEPLSGYRVLFCVNLPAVDEPTGTRLREYVERGGNLFWFCGDNVQPEAYNQMNQRAKGKLLPCTLLDVRAPVPGENRDSWNMASLDKEHPALGQLQEPPSLYQKVLVYKQVRVEPGKDKAAPRVLARLDDGEPLLVQKKLGQGSTTFFGSGAHTAWTNFPLRPLFLPLLARMTFDLCGVERIRHEGLAGAPIIVQFTKEIRPQAMEVVSPSGETIRREIKESTEGQGEFRFPETHEVGIYTLRPLQAVSAKPMIFAVNVDPDEASAAHLKPEELEELYPGTPVVFATDPDDLSETFKWLRQGKSLWGTFLTALLVVLVFETFISNQFTAKKGEDAGLEKLPVGMRRLAKKGKEEAA